MPQFWHRFETGHVMRGSWLHDLSTVKIKLLSWANSFNFLDISAEFHFFLSIFENKLSHSFIVWQMSQYRKSWPQNSFKKVGFGETATLETIQKNCCNKHFRSNYQTINFDILSWPAISALKSSVTWVGKRKRKIIFWSIDEAIFINPYNRFDILVEIRFQIDHLLGFSHT